MKSIFFWSEEKYKCFSNFTPVELVINGKTYASVEHYYQSEKSLDEIEQEAIRSAPFAAKAKRLAKKIKHLRPDWETYKLEAMRVALDEKFKQSPFRELLVESTGELFEDNPGDNFWGTAEKGGVGQGKNNLGKMLMEIREKLKKERK